QELAAPSDLPLPRVKIPDSAAHGELAAGRHLRHANIADLAESLEGAVQWQTLAAAKGHCDRFKTARCRRRLFQAGARSHHHSSAAALIYFQQEREPFGSEFRVG